MTDERAVSRESPPQMHSVYKAAAFALVAVIVFQGVVLLRGDSDLTRLHHGGGHSLYGPPPPGGPGRSESGDDILLAVYTLASSSTPLTYDQRKMTRVVCNSLVATLEKLKIASDSLERSVTKEQRDAARRPHAPVTGPGMTSDVARIDRLLEQLGSASSPSSVDESTGQHAPPSSILGDLVWLQQQPDERYRLTPAQAAPAVAALRDMRLLLVKRQMLTTAFFSHLTSEQKATLAAELSPAYQDAAMGWLITEWLRAQR